VKNTAVIIKMFVTPVTGFQNLDERLKECVSASILFLTQLRLLRFPNCHNCYFFIEKLMIEYFSR
jgi:hypothetical protein